MKVGRVLVFGLCFLMVMFSSVASDAKTPVAVLDFEGIGIGENELARIVTEHLTTEIIKSGRYTVVEREFLQKILEEQELQSTGLVDPETAVIIGSLVGARYLVMGSLTKIGEIYTLNYRIVNVETGIADESGSVSGRGMEELSSMAVRLAHLVTMGKALKSVKKIAVASLPSSYQGMSSMIFHQERFYIVYSSYETDNYDVFLKVYDKGFNFLQKIQITNSEDWNDTEPNVAGKGKGIVISFQSKEEPKNGQLSTKSNYYIKLYDSELSLLEETLIDCRPRSIAYADGHFYFAYPGFEIDDRGKKTVLRDFSEVRRRGLSLSSVRRNTYVAKYNEDLRRLKETKLSFLDFSGSYSLPSSLLVTQDRVYVTFEANETKKDTDVFLSLLDSELNFLEKIRITTLHPSSEWLASICESNGRFYVAYSSDETGNLDVFLKTYDADFTLLNKEQVTFSDYDETYASIVVREDHIYISYDASPPNTYAFEGKRDVFVEIFTWE